MISWGCYDQEDHQEARAQSSAQATAPQGPKDAAQVTERPTPEQDAKTGRFVAGNSGNGGRPKGSRNALGEAFLNDLQDLWAKQGAGVLQDAREESPIQFAKMVAGLLPKELLVRKAPEEEMTDDDLADTIDALRHVAAELRRGDSEAGKGTGEAPRIQ